MRLSDLSDGHVERVVAEFWSDTGSADTFPRPVEHAVSLRLPLTIVKLPRAGVGYVRRWLRARRQAAPLPADDRRDLMGCLVACRGHGLAFVCGADPPDEQRLTVAHEAAHFLLDYLLPRRRVLDAFGPGAADVLDGLRPPTPAERAAALLGHLRIGPHVHLLPRAGCDEEADARVAAAEARADALALELVAPRERIAERLRREVGRGASDAGAEPAAVAARLGEYFGVPPAVFVPIAEASMRPRRSAVLAAAVAAARHQRERELP